MRNKYFKFKQFTVFHDKCAMKVGTDGVLLGAWATVRHCQSILDVGTGSGLIALMAAQRNNRAKITAIEIDTEAALQAKENVKNSPFNDRITVLPLSFQDFISSATGKFDLIVSNPPFFINSLPSPDIKRTDARHADLLTLNELFGLSKNLLSETGIFSLIYPFSERENIMSVAEKENLYLSRETVVFPTPHTLPKRILLEFSVQEREHIDRSELTIEEKRHIYTPEFGQLTKDFYLYL
ncbi:MAG: tRNA1(Val) (adenine(37)-N6)-methyltransferase [Petrimonas sp.]|jgi:tRNA1Val (adenine37-N6)-methyltransferase